MLTHDEFISRLQSLPSTFVKTHRSGNTGIGKTLEDLLGIIENNIQGPDTAETALKAGRKNSASMLTLFTKSPSPRRVNTQLLKKYGYGSPKDGEKILHCTLSTNFETTLRGEDGLKLDIIHDNDSDKLSIQNFYGDVEAYWTEESLRDAFLRKYRSGQLYYVKAESRGSGANEEFYFYEAWFLKGFSYPNFINLLKDGVVKIDIRIGQYPDGRTHDHGTGFRIFPKDLDRCFEERERLL